MVAQTKPTNIVCILLVVLLVFINTDKGKSLISDVCKSLSKGGKNMKGGGFFTDTLFMVYFIIVLVVLILVTQMYERLLSHKCNSPALKSIVSWPASILTFGCKGSLAFWKTSWDDMDAKLRCDYIMGWIMSIIYLLAIIIGGYGGGKWVSLFWAFVCFLVIPGLGALIAAALSGTWGSLAWWTSQAKRDYLVPLIGPPLSFFMHFAVKGDEAAGGQATTCKSEKLKNIINPKLFKDGDGNAIAADSDGWKKLLAQTTGADFSSVFKKNKYQHPYHSFNVTSDMIGPEIVSCPSPNGDFEFIGKLIKKCVVDDTACNNIKDKTACGRNSKCTYDEKKEDGKKCFTKPDLANACPKKEIQKDPNTCTVDDNTACKLVDI